MNTLFGDVYYHSNCVNSLSDDIELRWNGVSTLSGDVDSSWNRGEHFVWRCLVAFEWCELLVRRY